MTKREDRLLRDILEKLEEVLRLLRPHPSHSPTGVRIVQISKHGGTMITGTQVGGQSTFEADALLAGQPFPAGFPAGSVDTWTSDDPQVSIGPGPNANQVIASVPAADAQGSAPAGSPPSYNLTVSVQLPTPAGGSAPVPLKATVNVPLLPAAPPPPPVPDGVAINQVA